MFYASQLLGYLPFLPSSLRNSRQCLKWHHLCRAVYNYMGCLVFLLSFTIWFPWSHTQDSYSRDIFAVYKLTLQDRSHGFKWHIKEKRTTTKKKTFLFTSFLKTSDFDCHSQESNSTHSINIVCFMTSFVCFTFLATSIDELKFYSSWVFSFMSVLGWVWRPLQPILSVFLQLQEIEERFGQHD